MDFSSEVIKKREEMKQRKAEDEKEKTENSKKMKFSKEASNFAFPIAASNFSFPKDQSSIFEGFKGFVGSEVPVKKTSLSIFPSLDAVTYNAELHKNNDGIFEKEGMKFIGPIMTECHNNSPLVEWNSKSEMYESKPSDCKMSMSFLPWKDVDKIELKVRNCMKIAAKVDIIVLYKCARSGIPCTYIDSLQNEEDIPKFIKSMEKIKYENRLWYMLHYSYKPCCWIASNN